jgi:serine/threonine protein kinase
MAFSSLDAISPSTLTSCARSSTLLGKGAEAEVFLATVTFPGGETKRIATKMFYKASTAKAEISFYERLPRHDNILSVHGCYFDNNAQRWCVAMEYLRHGNVRESMITKAFPRHGPFMHRSLSGLMDALGALHANGMAHRDLKLDNVLLSCECAPEADCACLRTYSPSVRAKLSDFAMARQGTLMGVSSANLKGTMMYVPPERVEYDPANHQADFYCRGDVYALGLMTWEMLHFLHSGEVVSCAEAILPGVRNPQDVLIEISKGKFVPPCEFLPEPVQRYLRKCWHFKPAKRFKDAREARRVWEKIRADVHAVADKSQILQSSIGSSSKGTDAALLGSTASTNRDLTGVTTTTASPVRSSV